MYTSLSSIERAFEGEGEGEGMSLPCSPYIAACRCSSVTPSSRRVDEGVDVGVRVCHSRYTSTLRPSGHAVMSTWDGMGWVTSGEIRVG